MRILKPSLNTLKAAIFNLHVGCKLRASLIERQRQQQQGLCEGAQASLWQTAHPQGMLLPILARIYRFCKQEVEQDACTKWSIPDAKIMQQGHRFRQATRLSRNDAPPYTSLIKSA